MAQTLTTVASKQLALKERLAAERTIAAEVDKLVELHVDGGEVEITPGCWSRLVACPGIPSLRGRRQMAVPTIDSLQASAGKSSAPSAVSDAAKAESVAAFNRSGLMNRLVGRSKKQVGEGVRIEAAMKTVQDRVDSLLDRQSIARQRALALKKAGKQDEAIREMKKAKAVEKQLTVANAALEALERQEAALAQSNLQRELAAALNSTNKEMKKQQKGLLGYAERAVDDSVELRDDAEDIGAVFEGLVSGADAGVDDDDLLDELNAMLEDDDGASVAVPISSKPAQAAEAATAAISAAAFPSAPQTEVSVSDGPQLERSGLLSAGG